MKPAAAVTRNTFGHGTVYYIGGGISAIMLDELAYSIVKAQEIWHIESDKGVEVVREAGESKLWFLLNHTDLPTRLQERESSGRPLKQ